MRLTDLYEDAVARQSIENNDQQRNTLVFFEALRESLLHSKSGWFSWKKKQIKGIYVYGTVGVGKTFLMDLFYDNLDLKDKKRFHFHQFMQQVDHELRVLQGSKNPLRMIAQTLAKTTKVICFDEFMVEDVAYAMILAELLQALFQAGVVLVATSNLEPDHLYSKGVHRSRFLPAIAAIKSHCAILKLNEHKDYRLGRAPKLYAYLYPLTESVELQLEQQFQQLTGHEKAQGQISIQNRSIPFIACQPEVIWFDFKVLCHSPRSQLDYLELADRFSTIFVSAIPCLKDKDTLAALLLMHVVDVLYDRGVKLIISAQCPVEQLYQEGELKMEFQRTASRLMEMQSEDYLSRHPRRAQSNIQ